LSASVGAGTCAPRKQCIGSETSSYTWRVVQNIDVLELTNLAFRQIYGRAYLDLVNKAPHVLGYFYDLARSAWEIGRHGAAIICRLAWQKLNLRKFWRYSCKSQLSWDFSPYAPHSLPAERSRMVK